MTTLLYLLIGAGAGILSGLFGVGGGVIMVMAMAGLMKLPFLTATGTSLGAMLLPVGIFGAWEYYKTGHLDVRISLLLAAGLLVGAWGGARLALSAGPVVVQRSFAAFLLLMAIRMWVSAPR